MGDERAATKADKMIGERVRQRRLELGVSQEKLADQLGITFQQVQKYERGMNRIAASRLLDIGKALDTSVSWLISGVREAAAEGADQQKLATLFATREGAELLELLAAIKTKAIRRQVLDYVRTIVRGDS